MSLINSSVGASSESEPETCRKRRRQTSLSPSVSPAVKKYFEENEQHREATKTDRGNLCDKGTQTDEEILTCSCQIKNSQRIITNGCHSIEGKFHLNKGNFDKVLRQLLTDDQPPTENADRERCEQNSTRIILSTEKDHDYLPHKEKKVNGHKTTHTDKGTDHSYFTKKAPTVPRNKAKKERLVKNEEAVEVLTMVLERSDPVLCTTEMIGYVPQKMGNRKNGFVSVLMKKEPNDLQTLKLVDIIKEFSEFFPHLLHLLLKVMIPADASREEMANLVPRLALIYSITLQSRLKELSSLQRSVAVMLADNVCDQAVYDRLNRFGVSSPYCVAVDVLTSMGKLYPNLIEKAANDGKYIRLVGDNLNISIGTSHETMTSHKHMEHMFTSTCLIYEYKFLDMPQEPEVDIDALSMSHIILSQDEYQQVKRDVTIIVSKTIAKYIPHLSMLKDHVPEQVIPTNIFNETAATEVIPLPCLPFNEQKYQDDIKILEWYQSLCEKVIHNSNLGEDTKFQIGGDQLTRERFSEALLLRLDNIDPHDRFANLGRVTAEFFHLSMNLLEKGVFAELWSKDVDVEIGTLRGECERLSRNSVDINVMKAYDEDKRFATNYLEALTVEAALDYFKMESINSVPSNAPPTTNINHWIEEHIGNIIDEYVFPGWSSEKPERHLVEETGESKETLKVTLADGSVRQISIGKGKHLTARSRKPDKLKDYMHRCLEVLVIFKYLQELLKKPDRSRMLGLLKMIMIVLKGHSQNAKYPREILRILVQQYSVMGLNEACMVFQACFVNLKGKVDTHVPADLVQEWNVKESKKHIKHMFSNKTENNISNKTAALPLVHSVAENIDAEIGTVVRSKRHKEKDSDVDEMLMMTDFHNIKPFQHIEGRYFKGFKKIKKSVVEMVDGFQLRQWFMSNKNRFIRH